MPTDNYPATIRTREEILDELEALDQEGKLSDDQLVSLTDEEEIERIVNPLPEKMEIFISQFESNSGNIKRTCSDLGIQRSTYYRWMDRSERFRQRINEVAEGIIDDAEDGLKFHVKQKSLEAIKYFLDRKGRERGYGGDISSAGLGAEVGAGAIRLETIREAFRGAAEGIISAMEGRTSPCEEAIDITPVAPSREEQEE